VERETRSEVYTLHVQVAEKDAIFGLQLPPKRLRIRDYRRVSVPGGLEATVAYGMAMLAEVAEEDICLDPMCGGATTLIEAGLAFRPKRLIGGDLSPARIAAAHENARAAQQDIYLALWDTNRLPLADASVDVLLCNFPYGKKVAQIPPSVIPELVRVIRPGGRAAFLATEEMGIDSYLKASPSSLSLRRRLQLRLRGVDPLLYVFRKTGGGIDTEQRQWKNGVGIILGP